MCSFAETHRRKFSNKKLKVDPKTHDLVVESTHGHVQQPSVNALSSGEQHQLVLAYDLLFSHPAQHVGVTG